MKKSISIILLIFASHVINAQNENQKEHAILSTLMDHSWIGSGTLMGKDATFSMDWNSVLDNTFIKLEFQNSRKLNTNEDLIFKANAYYKIVNDSMLVGNWFDNRGVTFPLKGSIKENKLTIFWGNEETEVGKTIYQYNKDNNTIVTEDYIMNNGSYIKFGSAIYNTKDQ